MSRAEVETALVVQRTVRVILAGHSNLNLEMIEYLSGMIARDTTSELAKEQLIAEPAMSADTMANPHAGVKWEDLNIAGYEWVDPDKLSDPPPKGTITTSDETGRVLHALVPIPRLAHGFTRHGHPCCNAAVQRPSGMTIARCGGPGLCSQCKTDAPLIHSGAVLLDTEWDPNPEGGWRPTGRQTPHGRTGHNHPCCPSAPEAPKDSAIAACGGRAKCNLCSPEAREIHEGIRKP